MSGKSNMRKAPKDAWVKLTLRRRMGLEHPDWEVATTDGCSILGKGGDTFYETSHNGVHMIIGDSDLLTPRQLGKVKAACASRAGK